ncbi:DUF317 domain-containing protein [Streptomyces sp. NPDC056244]|uniref:DUF317 domain-containing protein n=1 Tax=Streptomyces sp. NPDC056244 TaxID=3345762 RepID=UPI0035DBDAC9
MSVAPAAYGFSTTIEAMKLHSWQLGPGQPTQVTDLFSAESFHLVVDDRADVHVSSKDGRFYLGWFPSGRPGTDGEGWKIAVTGTAAVPGYSISFDTETPAEIVAAAVQRVLAGSRPL